MVLKWDFLLQFVRVAMNKWETDGKSIGKCKAHCSMGLVKYVLLPIPT